ncbi:MAG: hypothetical protein KA520_10990 [Nitrosomonas sp.]|nr:hypothetical protein [Nitrosomonas sp.]
MQVNQLLKSVMCMFTMVIWLGSIDQNALAHTTIEPPQITEGQQSNNNVVITHGCGDEAVIGQSVVIPDGDTSTITANGNPYNGPLSDFLQNWGNVITFVQDRSVFSEQDRKVDANGNTIGFWFGGGRTVASYARGHIPFVSSAVLFVPESCAKVVRFALAVADICKITDINNMAEEGSVNFWVPAVGSIYDGTPGGHAYDFPVFFTVNRDLNTNPLPESCGAGLQVAVKPSAAQVNRDLPIIFNGTQVWPQP